MNYKKLNSFLIGHGAYLAFLSSTMFFGCVAENDMSALSCFTVDCDAMGENDEDSGHNDRNKSGSDGPDDCDFYESYPYLSCDRDNEGKTLFSRMDRTIYVCEKDAVSGYSNWNPYYNMSKCNDYKKIVRSSSSSSEKSSSSSKEKDIPNDCETLHSDLKNLECNSSRYGTVLYVVSEETIYACEFTAFLMDYTWVNHPELKSCKDYTPQGLSSSSTPKSSSSSKQLSSSSITKTSSSSAKQPSSSSSNFFTLISSSSSPQRCGDFWCGPEHNYIVSFPLYDGNTNTTEWDSYTDNVDGGISEFSFPVERGNVYSDKAFDPIFEYCDGICGAVTLGSGTMSGPGYAGLFLDVANGDSYGANVIDWGGICITYQVSKIAPIIEIVPADESLTGGIDNYIVRLDASKTVADIFWEDFKQEMGGKYAFVDLYDVLAQLKIIRIAWRGKDRKKAEFNITSIGRYGSCN